MEKRKKKLLLPICAIVICFLMINGCSGSDEKKEETQNTVVSVESESSSATEAGKHIYDNAVVKDVMNGSRTEKIGEYSIINMDSSELTDDVLADWYFNYVAVNDFNWCMILYTDKNDNSGVYAIEGMISKDTCFEVDEYGDYSVLYSEDEITYFPADDGKTLKKLE